MGNSLEETIGLMVSITEQTRNANKAARGLNTIMANLAAVLDDTSSNGKKIKQIYDDLELSMEGTNGQMKSGYELLSDLAGKWSGLSSDTQKYIATTIAGTTQLNNFVALMNNFGHATKATETALDSAGSAAEENARYMGSLEAQTTAVKAEFESLANNVIPNELISAFLKAGKAILSFVNNDVGAFITRIALVSAVVIGGGNILLGYIVKIKQMIVAVKAATGAMAAFQASLGWIALAAGVIFAVAGAVSQLNQKAEPAVETMEDLSAGLNEVQTKLKELSETPVTDRTGQWYAEYIQLKNNNEELERRKKLLTEQQAQEKLETARSSRPDMQTKYTLVSPTSIYDYGGYFWDKYVLGDFGLDWETWKENNSHIIDVYDTLEEAQKAAEFWGGTIEKQTSLISKQAVDLNKNLQDSIDLFKQGGEVSVQDQSYIAGLLNKYGDYYSKLKQVQQAEEQGVLARGTLTEEEREFINLFEQASTVYGEASQKLETYGIKLKDVQKVAPDLATYLNQAGWSINSLADYCDNAGVSLDVLKEKMIAAAKAAIVLETYEEQREKLGASEFLRQYGRRGVQQLGKNKTVLNADLVEIEQQIENAFSLASLVQSTRSSGNTTVGGTGDTTKTLTQAEKNLQAFRSQLAYFEHELAMGEITEEQYYYHLHDLMNMYLQDAENVETLWKYQEKIYKHSQEELQNYYQEQLDQQNALIDKINERFDAEIAGLEKSNDELEKQIEYEQLLEDMASAKAKKSLVFKNGAFQYVEDVDAISSAQNALRKYYRQQEVEQKKQNIEAARQRELREPQQLVSRLEEIIKNIKGYATGTTYSAGGLSLVGEHGAELAVLSKGTGVIPADITKNLWAWGQTTPSALMSTVAGVNGQNGGIYFSGVTMSFPSVRNGNDAQSFMQSVVNLAYQRAYSRK